MQSQLDEELMDDPLVYECPSTSSTTTQESDTGTDRRPSNLKNPNPFYDYFLAEGKDARVCKACKTKISAKTGTTTAAINHLKRKHVSEFRRYEIQKAEWMQKKSCSTTKFSSKIKKPNEDETQPSIKMMFEKKEIWPATNSQAVQLTKQIAKFIVGGFHPYSIVEETHFKGLIKVTSPRYQVPSRTTFSRNVIPKMNEELKDKIKNEMKSFNDLQSWSFTTDGWTSRKNDGYMSLTSHCLTNDFEIKSYCLALKQINVQHTGANIYEAIKEVIQEWEIENIIDQPTKRVPIYAVTDGAANMKSAIALSKCWNQIDCFGHVLQLCIEDAIKDTVPVSHLMAKCRAIVGHYSRSSTANARLRAEQQKLGLKPLELIQDVPTRWNSQYFMLERLLKCRDAVNLELGTSDTKINTLNGTEWVLAENVMKVFEPLVEATQFSSGENYPTISAVLPMIYGIEMVYHDIKEKDGLIPFGEAIKRNLKTRFGPLESNPTYLIATIVDPKYKLQGLKKDLHLAAEIQLTRELKTSAQTTASSTEKAASTSDQEAESTSRSIFKFLQQRYTAPSSAEEVATEVNMFLKTPIIKHNESSLSWWRKNKTVFPKIAEVARKYLGIPATSVPSERLFSSAGNVISARRIELLPEHAEQLVVLHDNIKHIT